VVQDIEKTCEEKSWKLFYKLSIGEFTLEEKKRSWKH